MTAAVELHRTNTILYCDRWADTVAFYRHTLGLAVTHANDWFVEVHLADTAPAPAIRWNSAFVELFDPEGTRIELWSPAP